MFHLFEAPTSGQHRLPVGLTSGIFADCEFGGIAPRRPRLAKMDSEAVCSKSDKGAPNLEQVATAKQTTRAVPERGNWGRITTGISITGKA